MANLTLSGASCAADVTRQFEVGDDLFFGDVDKKARPAIETLPIALHDVDYRHFAQRIDRHVDGHAQIDADLGEIDAGFERIAEREFGQGNQVGVGRGRDERLRRQYAILGMVHAGEGLDTDELFFAQIDLRLIPEFDPFFGERVAEVDTAGEGGVLTELVILKHFYNETRLKGLVEHRQHVQAIPFAGGFGLGEHACAAAAGELDQAAIVRATERGEAFGGITGLESDINKDEFGHSLSERLGQRMAVGEFLRIDAAALQEQ